MKPLSYVLFILAIGLGSLSFACPEIDGKYKQVFPVSTNSELLISSHDQDGGKAFHLAIPNSNGPTWSWQVTVGNGPQPMDFGTFYRNVFQEATCKNNQLYVKTSGELLDGDKVIRFTQEWFIYRGTLGNLRWQINYRDDTTTEPRISLFGYDKGE